MAEDCLDVKTVNIGNEMAVTISIGVGLDGLTYAQNYEFARNAIDLALGRGGDQAVRQPERGYDADEFGYGEGFAGCAGGGDTEVNV